MKKYALALAVFGLVAGVACQGEDNSNYEVTDSATPYTIAVSGMT